MIGVGIILNSDDCKGMPSCTGSSADSWTQNCSKPYVYYNLEYMLEMAFLCLKCGEQVIKYCLILFSTNCQWLHCIALATQFLFNLLA